MPKKAPTGPKSETHAERPKPGTTTAPDLAAYRAKAPARAEPATNEAEERALRPKAHWEDLADIDGLSYIDGWQDTDETYGPYTGSVVRVPAVGKNPALEVVVITNQNTSAGKAVVGHLNHVKFGSDGKMTPSPVMARLRPSPNYPNGRPRVMLTFG